MGGWLAGEYAADISLSSALLLDASSSPRSSCHATSTAHHYHPRPRVDAMMDRKTTFCKYKNANAFMHSCIENIHNRGGKESKLGSAITIRFNYKGVIDKMVKGQKI
ncbi:hypothetical protein BU24DRAFT_46568 [Aaosphaeria arxii CBS 175.79]|uniref:Uncharacterized protein n=1 Tax=Aaosphaeria arxii CBS 175.79 TaxID=1450172 RepID=A0A6A5XDD2_9PLEO|nr:uncharacterized protein BU24DRAFT_46568 [Aaosphaeria arxii CBS 175.79]KAF2010816.1 hypothetical protein BU24DRAFT_46568 [Aaosphaeria arxii CBS 175.79]